MRKSIYLFFILIAVSGMSCADNRPNLITWRLEEDKYLSSNDSAVSEKRLIRFASKNKNIVINSYKCEGCLNFDESFFAQYRIGKEDFSELYKVNGYEGILKRIEKRDEVDGYVFLFNVENTYYNIHFHAFYDTGEEALKAMMIEILKLLVMGDGILVSNNDMGGKSKFRLTLR